MAIEEDGMWPLIGAEMIYIAHKGNWEVYFFSRKTIISNSEDLNKMQGKNITWLFSHESLLGWGL